MSADSARVAPSALAGILFLVTAVACFAVLDTTVKYVGATVSVVVSVWFRYAFQAVAMAAVHAARARAGHCPAPSTRASSCCAACC